eukprot:6753949-Pyramimonas_sp.AAC.1
MTRGAVDEKERSTNDPLYDYTGEEQADEHQRWAMRMEGPAQWGGGDRARIGDHCQLIGSNHPIENPLAFLD